MAFAARTTWGVGKGGSDSNGGGGRSGAAASALSAPGVTGSGTGGTVAAGTYYVVVTANDGYGETAKSAETSVVTSGATSKITVTSPTAAAGLMNWTVYMGTVSGGPYFLQGSVSGNTIGTSVVRTTTPATTGTQAPGTDYSRQDAVQITYTDLVIDAVTNTNATSAGHPFTPDLVGSVVNITSGVNFTVQRAQIIGVAAGVATFDKALGTVAAVAGNGVLGGRLLTVNAAFNLMLSGNKMAVQYNATVYSITTGMTLPGTATTVFGYQTSYGDNTGSRPIIQAGAGITLFTMSTFSQNCLLNLDLDGNNVASSRGVALGQTALIENCVIRNFKSCGVQNTSGANSFNIVFNCEVKGCAGTAAVLLNDGDMLGSCTVHGNTTVGVNGGSVITDSLFYANTGGTSDGVNDGNNASGMTITSCSSYGNGQHGFSAGSSNYGCVISKCIAEGNAGWGFNMKGASNDTAIMTCAAYNNTLGNYTSAGGGRIYSFFDLTGSPFVNAAGGNFALNSTAGAGTICRLAGYPGIFPGGASTGYPDIGGVQTSGGPGTSGMLVNPGMSGGIRG